TSILEGLKEKYPHCQIDWLTSKSAKDVLLLNPYLESVFIWEAEPELKDYDLVIGLEDDFEVCDFVSSLAPKAIAGAYALGGKAAYTPSAWFDMSAISRFGLTKANQLKQLNKKTFQQHMGDLLGIRVGRYVFSLTPDEIELGKKVVRDLGFGVRDQVVGINTGAGRRWQYKSLSVEKTIDLVNRIKKELGRPSLILGGEEEKERNEIIAKETGMPNAGLHSLRGFAAIINQCQTLVSSDSLAMHFGIALGRKLVVFFGPTSAAEIELYGLGKKVHPKMDCLVCYKKTCDKKPSCMDLLSIDDLFTAIKPFVS
ncbi:MAG: glycosyltransferase family 9 protein, partial [Candidatus Margulisbacteria bacterium]|nr:glycosyltransferase family 9 protein [Candidatus Margulisiibacteriota bacterium]